MFVVVHCLSDIRCVPSVTVFSLLNDGRDSDFLQITVTFEPGVDLGDD